MLDNEAMVNLIDLINAVNEDNLELTKKIVDYFNEVTNIKQVPNINQHFTLEDIRKNINNESFNYVVNNIKGMNDYTKWELKVAKLKNNNSEEEIENFILDYLNNENLNNQKLSSLIQLATNINRYDLLNLIAKKLKELI